MKIMNVSSDARPGEAEALVQIAEQSGLFQPDSVIEKARFMPGGLTNRNFEVFIDGKKFAMRIAGPGTAEYLNRPCEKDAVSKICKMGTSPEFYYYDETTGSNISRFVEGDVMHREDFQTRSDVLKHAAQLVRALHTSGIEMSDVFDPFKEIINYREYLQERGWKRYFPEMEMLNAMHDKIRDVFEKNPPQRVCSHNDCLSENFLYDVPNNFIELIDWEYCGMNFYSFDVAAVISENELSEEKEEEFIRYYFGGEPTERQRAEVLIGKFIMDGLWVPWALVQAVNKPDEEEDYWEWGYVRVNRCMKHMADPRWDRYLELLGKPE